MYYMVPAQGLRQLSLQPKRFIFSDQKLEQAPHLSLHSEDCHFMSEDDFLVTQMLDSIFFFKIAKYKISEASHFLHNSC